MAVLEAESIENLLHEHHPNKKTEFADVTWITDLIDTNAYNYNTGLVKFDTLAQRMSLIDYRYGFVNAPMVMACVANPFTANTAPNVALKNGIAQLVYSMSIKCNGVKIQDSQELNRYNAILQMVNDSADWQVSNGAQYHLAKDTRNSNNLAEYTLATTPFPALDVNGVTLNAGALVGTAAVPPAGNAAQVVNNFSRNNTYNEGFYRRISFINQHYRVNGSGNGYWAFDCIIPLRLVSGFFAELNVPLYNTHFHISLGITSLVPNSEATPIMADNDALAAGGGVTRAIRIGIGKQLEAQGYPATDSSCRLYLPELKLRGENQAKFTKLLDTGFSKSVTFYDVKSFKNPNNDTTANNNLKCLLTPGISSPARIFTTLYPRGSAQLHTSPSPCQSTGVLSTSNIIINNKRQYPVDIQKDFEHWDLLKREFFAGGIDNQTGSLITYQDFADKLYGNHRYYCHNIQQFVQGLPNPEDPVAIQFDGRIEQPAAGAVDYEVWHHIEYEVTVNINMSTGKVTTINTA